MGMVLKEIGVWNIVQPITHLVTFRENPILEHSIYLAQLRHHQNNGSIINVCILLIKVLSKMLHPPPSYIWKPYLSHVTFPKLIAMLFHQI